MSKNIVICLDYSGSMSSRLSGSEPGIEKYCMLDLANLLLLSLVKGLPEGVNLSIIGFSSTLLRILPPTMITEDSRNQIFEQVRDSGLKPQGMTAMWEVLQKAVREFSEQSDGDNTILLLTDGNPTTTVPAGGLAKSLQQFVKSKMSPDLKFTLHSFGLGREVDSGMLDELTNTFGGANIFVSDPGMAAAAFSARCTSLICPRIKDPSANLKAFSDIYTRNITKILTILESRDTRFRGVFVPAGDPIITQCQVVFDDFSSEIATWLEDSDPDVLFNLTDQIGQACSRWDWASDWGIHYLRSMRSAHSRYEVVSALDSALQEYIPLYPDEWETCLQDLDECFMNIPVPDPCIEDRRGCYNSVSSSAAPPINLQRVVVDSGCFHPDCLVSLSDGRRVPCRQLSKGDKILTHNNIIDTVLTVVKSQSQYLYQLPDGGPRVTAWHPVLWNEKWCFPVYIPGVVKIEYYGEVYSFLLASRGSSLIFDGVPGVALAHGLNGLPKHDFWGTEVIVRSMIKIDPYVLENGIFDLGNVIFQRDEKTNEVVGFDPLNKETVSPTKNNNNGYSLIHLGTPCDQASSISEERQASKNGVSDTYRLISKM
tara:strand:- start:893 stop:2683 length:1791 start_codon:yes stop_codon:yes gene_type:complete